MPKYDIFSCYHPEHSNQTSDFQDTMFHTNPQIFPKDSRPGVHVAEKENCS